jgi:light-independent protochlorophyllide reductase subunit B
MGLEEHLLGMFREDFEFSADATASHLGAQAQPALEVMTASAAWDAEAEKELKKIPFFVRGKARRNTEAFAAMNKLPLIKLDTLYDAKAYFSQ